MSPRTATQRQRTLAVQSWTTVTLLLSVTAILAAVWTAGEPPGDHALTSALTIDALIDIKHPSDAIWSPAGRQIAVLWRRAGVQDVWVINVDTPGSLRRLTQHSDGLVQEPFWSRDGSAVHFVRQGALWQAQVDGKVAPRPVWAGAEPTGGV